MCLFGFRISAFPPPVCFGLPESVGYFFFVSVIPADRRGGMGGNCWILGLCLFGFRISALPPPVCFGLPESVGYEFFDSVSPAVRAGAIEGELLNPGIVFIRIQGFRLPTSRVLRTP